nr:uncharacterized protein LOC128682936 [Plodia interpunctella]
MVTFNCKNIKRSVDYVRQLCKTSAIIALQETWLLPSDIAFLDNIHDDFGCTGMSSMDTGAGMLRGRPYGGIALLWNKQVFRNVSIVQCDNPRVCAIKIALEARSVFVFNVYMPFEDPGNQSEFTDTLSLVSAIINNESAEEVYILGDFNAHPTKTFYAELSAFCSEEHWTCVDVQKLGLSSGTYTFVSDSNGSRTWLDHCVVSASVLQSVCNIYVMNDVCWSDHSPLVVECNLNLKINLCHNNLTIPQKTAKNKILWGDRNLDQIEMYTKICNEKLNLICCPDELVCCSKVLCDNDNHKTVLKELYNDIICVLSEAASATCKQCYLKPKRKPVVGWNRHVSEAHREARCKHQIWLLYNKPNSGSVYNEMVESRKIFKSRLKWCQNHEEQLKMDIIASHHRKHDFKGFWKATNKLGSKPKLPVSVDGLCEHSSIADMFREQFSVKSPLGPPQSKCSTGLCGQEIYTRFTADDIDKIIKCMCRGKSPGHDGLSIEHLQHAGLHLPRVLNMLFSLCMSHSYLPSEMMKTVVVPIVKNRTGDTSDRTNSI